MSKFEGLIEQAKKQLETIETESQELRMFHLDQAKALYQKAKEAAGNDLENQAIAIAGLGEVEYRLGNRMIAENFYIQALDLIRQSSNNEELIASIKEKRRVLASIPESLNLKLNKSKEALSDNSEQLHINLTEQYTDEDINGLVNIFVTENRGYVNENSSLLAQKFSDEDKTQKFSDEDKKEYYVVVTGAVDHAGKGTKVTYFLDKTAQPEPASAQDDRKDVFDDVIPCIRELEEAHIKILFPFNITQLHWLTAEIKIHIQGRNEATVECYCHDPYGEGRFSDSNFREIEQVIRKKLSAVNYNVNEITNKVSPYNRRQATGDRDSCGVIVVEDIEKRILGYSLDVQNPYDKGASELRQNHMVAVKSLPQETNWKKGYLERMARKSEAGNDLENQAIAIAGLGKVEHRLGNTGASPNLFDPLNLMRPSGGNQIGGSSQVPESGCNIANDNSDACIIREEKIVAFKIGKRETMAPFSDSRKFQLEFDWQDPADFSIITGPNGSGKTYLLERIKDVLERPKDKPLTFTYIGSEEIEKFDSRSSGLFHTRLDELKSSIYAFIKSASKERYRPKVQTIGEKLLKHYPDLASKSDDEINYLIQQELQTPTFMQDSPTVLSFQITSVISSINETTKETKENLLKDLIQPHRILEEPYDFWRKKNPSCTLDDFKNFLKKKTELNNLIKEIVDAKIKINPLEEINKILPKRFEYKFIEQSSYFFLYPKNLTDLDQKNFIRPETLSSGQKFILKIALLILCNQGMRADKDAQDKYLVNKPKIILLDEPDKHLDPKSLKIFFDFMHDLSIREKIQVIMTTHRTDTIALIPLEEKPNCQVYTIREQEGVRHVEKTSNLLAMFRLTENLRALTAVTTKVFVEASNDALAFAAFYKSLMHYSTQVRESAKEWPIGENTRRILSRRYQVSFDSVCFEDTGGGGCKFVEESVRRNLEAMKNQKRYAISWLERDKMQVTLPFGILDRDYGYEFQYKNDVFQARFVKLKRHSIENFLFDPFILSSIPIEEKIEDDFTNENTKIAFINLRAAIQRKDEKVINECLKNYFQSLFRDLFNKIQENESKMQKLLDSKLEGKAISKNAEKKIDENIFKMIVLNSDTEKEEKLFNLLGEILEVKDNLIKNKDSGLIDQKFSGIKEIIKKIKTKLETEPEDKEECDRSEYHKNIAAKMKLSIFINICNKIKLEEFLLHRRLKNCHGDVSKMRDEKKLVILDKDNIVTVNYPFIFCNYRGHDLKEFYPLKDKTRVIKAVYFALPAGAYLPMDLAEVFFDLNDKIREQAKEVVRGSSGSKTAPPLVPKIAAASR